FLRAQALRSPHECGDSHAGPRASVPLLRRRAYGAERVRPRVRPGGRAGRGGQQRRSGPGRPTPSGDVPARPRGRGILQRRPTTPEQATGSAHGGSAVMTLLTTGSVLAAFFAGMVALFAPCCIVFLAPSYLAAAARNSRWRLLPLTFIFAAGLAVIMVPITLGMSLIAGAIAKY